MSQPSVTITELDGAIGATPSGAPAPLAVVGACAVGTADVPVGFGKTTALIAAHTAGPAVEFAASFIDAYSRPVVLVPTGKTVAGDYPAVADATTQTGTGTSVATTDGTTEPQDSYEGYIIVIAGGTIATPGITYQYSLDGGRTLSPVTALGSDAFIVIPNSGGVKVLLAAGTLVAGDTIAFRADEPQWNAAELTTALTALKNYSGSWQGIQIIGEIDATAFAAIETSMTSLFGAGKYRWWLGNTRIPDVGIPAVADETEAAYKTALDAIFGSLSSVHGELCAGACEVSSAVTGRRYRRPISFYCGGRTASLSEERNIADVTLGSAAGVIITDANGNPKHHDESINPGLDDSRFTVLRTIEGLSGVFVNRPRIFSSGGSDFELMPHRRVINLAHAAIRLYFLARLNRSILVDASTGFILESEAQEIEAGVDAAVRSSLMTTPKASGGGYAQGRFFQLNRDDNLLSTKTLTGQARVIPLAYVEFVTVDVGFFNPAMVLVA